MPNVRFQKSSVLTKKEKDRLLREAFNKEVTNIVPAVYSSIALALSRNWGFGYERINRLFLQSQEIWDELGTDNMIDLCERETGILLKGE